METWQILQYMDMKKRRNGRKREQEKGWRGKDNGREGMFRGGEKNIWKGKGLKKFNLDIVQDKGGEIRNKGGG